MDSPSQAPAVPTAMAGEAVKFKLVTDGEIEGDNILRAISRMPGIANPNVSTREGTLTFDYTGEITDLPNIERMISSSRMRVYLINPARVVLTLQSRDRAADPRNLQNTFYSSLGVRLANVSGSSMEVYANLEQVCVCRMTATAREAGFEATPQSHLDVTMRVSGQGDMVRLVNGLRAVNSVINVAPSQDGASVGILSAGRLNVRTLRQMAEDAGFTVEGVEGT